MDTNKIDTRFAELDRKVDALGHYVGELNRKSDGTTRANREVASNERKLVQLTEEVAGLQARFNNLGAAAGPAQGEAILADLKRLDSRTESLWKDLNTQLQELRARVDTHEDRIDEHDKRLDNHDLKFANHGERLEGVEVTVGSHARSIATLAGRGSNRPHAGAYIVALLAGVLAAWWWGVHDWTNTVTSGDVETVVNNPSAEAWWATVLCGLFVALLVLGILALFWHEDVEAESTTAEAEAAAGAQVRIDRSAPTRVQPAVNNLPPPPVASQHAGVR